MEHKLTGISEWELDLHSSIDIRNCHRVAVIGPGRLGTALTRALTDVGIDVAGPYGRRAAPYPVDGSDVVLLCVPDAEIATVAEQLTTTAMIGHCSGATGLDVFGGHPGFSLHPLTTITAAGTGFDGIGAAVDGTDTNALAFAEAFARRLGMLPFRIGAADRAAYHAAASIASNFLITLEAAAECLALSCGVDRDLLAPLVRASVENWVTLGPQRALTGPVARGDIETVKRQRDAVADRAPELLQLFDAMVLATQSLAGVPA